MMMQQGVNVPGLIGNSGDSAMAEGLEPGAGGGAGGSGGSGGLNEEEKGRSEESERNSGGSRWPRQETIALLKIRSDMDVAFRDSSLKGPLWEEVSRKLAELGYHRSAKKCKEKFENVYKYHKRTKDGRNTKPDGKTYRFFEQLEALDTHPPLLASSSPLMKSQTVLTSVAMQLGNTTSHMSTVPTPIVAPQVTVSSTPSPISTVFPSNAIHPINLSSHNNVVVPPQPVSITSAISPSQVDVGRGVTGTDMNMTNSLPTYNHHNNTIGSMLSDNSTSSTSSDEQPPERCGKRKRNKWEDFFGRLMNEVIQKQDELQKKFLDTLEKRERDRTMREEAWRVQEMAKMNREHDLLLQERSMAAAKDAAVIAFLQKITEQQQHNPQSPIIVPPLLNPVQVQENRSPLPPQVSQPQQQPPPSPPVSQPQPKKQPPPAPVVQVQAPPQSTPPAPVAPQPLPPPPVKSKDIVPYSNYNGGADNSVMLSPSPSRWPKAEVQALIKLRTTLDTKYHESGPKGPLWEEISAAMRKIGYNRNAKRCKEKWENINKYYKKVKESNKKRPEDAKTCPYFHQLEAIYKEKATNQMTVPIMAQPEQQWPQLPQEQQQNQHHPLQVQQQQQKQQQKDQDHESDINMDDQNMNDDEYDDEDEDEDDVAGYEIVTNKQQQTSSVATTE